MARAMVGARNWRAVGRVWAVCLLVFLAGCVGTTEVQTDYVRGQPGPDAGSGTPDAALVDSGAGGTGGGGTAGRADAGALADAGGTAGGGEDAGRPDAGAAADAGSGTGQTDAGVETDVGGSPDTGGEPEPVDDRVYTVAVLSDLNDSYGSTTYGTAVHQAVGWLTSAVRPDLVITTGDMVAGQQAGLNYRAMWAGFHNAVTLPLERAGIPIAVTPGNHDASGYRTFADERAIFVDEWQQHRPNVQMVDATHYPLHYAYELGPALFISLDATTVGSLSADQRQWVANVLASRAEKPVKIVYGHVPLSPVAQGRETEILNDAALEAILNQHQVTMMVSGHHHAYYPARRGSLRLVHTACLGSGARVLIGEVARSERSAIVFHYNRQGIVSLEAHRPDAQATVVGRSTLPRSLNSGVHLLTRDDL